MAMYELRSEVEACLAMLGAEATGFMPVAGIVLGSGLGGLTRRLENPVSVPYVDLPWFPVSTVPGHSGDLLMGELAGVPVVLFAGRSHYYENGDPRAMALPLALLSAMGAKSLILSNAAGSTRLEMTPGTLMLITDHINWSGENPLIGHMGDAGFIDMTQAYDRTLCDYVRQAAANTGQPLAEGTYGWFSGPSYETPAEVRMAGMLGIDAVGMSTVPETILARSMGMRVGAVSLITNLGAGLGQGELHHGEVKEEGAKAANRFEALIIETVRLIGAA